MWLLVHPDNDYAVTFKSNDYIKKWDISNEIPKEIAHCSITFPVYNPTCDYNNIGTVHMKGKVAEKDNCLFEIYSWDDLGLIANNKIKDLEDKLFWFQSLAFSLDGKTIALASFNECLAIINRSDFTCKKLIDGGEWISGVIFSNTSKYIAAAHTFQGGGRITIYKNSKEDISILHKELYRTPGMGDFSDSVANMIFSKDDRYLVVCETSINGTTNEDKGKLMLYEIATGKLIWAVILKSEGGINFYPSIVMNSDDNQILCGVGYGKIYCYKVSDGKCVSTYNSGSNTLIHSLGMDKKRNRLWILNEDQSLICLSV